MKKNIEILFKTLGIALGKIYPYRFNLKIRLLYHWIYSFWVSSFFNSIGKYSRIRPMSFLKGGKYITIGSNVYIGKNSVLTAWDKYQNNESCPEITIGDGTLIGEYCHISAINKIEIGKNVLTGRWLTIVDNSHGVSSIEMVVIPPLFRDLYSKGSVIIEDNVWIGDKVTILAGVKIGKGSIIGANAVVTNDIPENSIAGGNPARLIKLMI